MLKRLTVNEPSAAAAAGSQETTIQKVEEDSAAADSAAAAAAAASAAAASAAAAAASTSLDGVQPVDVSVQPVVSADNNKGGRHKLKRKKTLRKRYNSKTSLKRRHKTNKNK